MTLSADVHVTPSPAPAGKTLWFWRMVRWFNFDGGTWLLLGAIGLPLSLSIAIIDVTWRLLPKAAPEQTDWILLGVAGVLLIGSLIAGRKGLVWQSKVAESQDLTELQSQQRRVGRTLSGLGYAMLVLALLNGLAFAGFAWTGMIRQVIPLTPAATTPAPKDAAASEALGLCTLLVVSMTMAIFGALLFAAITLLRRREIEDRVDLSGFTGSLILRIGQSILYTVAVFLLLRLFGGTNPAIGTQWLPVLALFAGLFVASVERVLVGLAMNMLAAVDVLLPMHMSERERANRRGSSIEGSVRLVRREQVQQPHEELVEK